MSSVARSSKHNNMDKPKLHKVKRKTLSVVSLSDLRHQISRSSQYKHENDEDTPARPIWLDSDDEEETLDERFIFTLADEKKSSSKSTKRSAILSPRVLDKENMCPSLNSSSSALPIIDPSLPPTTSASQEREETVAKPRRKASRSLLLRSKRDDAIESATPSSTTALPPSPALSPSPLPGAAADGPACPLPPDTDAASRPPPLPPRDYDAHYSLPGGRARSRTYADPAQLRKAGLTASCSSFSAAYAPILSPQRPPLRPHTGVQGTRSMYELSSVGEESMLVQSQPVYLNRSYQHQLERRAPDAKSLKRLEKKEKKQMKKVEKQLKKEQKKNGKKTQKEKRGKEETAYFVDTSLPCFDEVRPAQLLL